jgi:outer membrane protein assembly factor BamD
MNQSKDPKAASKKFEEVDRQHPYSDWARKSLLMSAYAFYNAGDFDSCIGAATRYVTLHPGSPDAAYAQFLIAASHYDQIPDTSRDQGRTEKAIAALEEVVRKYPTSEYATSAKAKLEGARDQLAGKEMTVGRYYMQKRDYTAAINRFKTVVTQYQTTRHVEEALARLTEAYMAIGIVGEAQTAAAVLGHNFPDSKWYKDAYGLVKSGGLEPSENPGSYISKAFKKLGLG